MAYRKGYRRYARRAYSGFRRAYSSGKQKLLGIKFKRDADAVLLGAVAMFAATVLPGISNLVIGKLVAPVRSWISKELLGVPAFKIQASMPGEALGTGSGSIAVPARSPVATAASTTARGTSTDSAYSIAGADALLFGTF